MPVPGDVVVVPRGERYSLAGELTYLVLNAPAYVEATTSTTNERARGPHDPRDRRIEGNRRGDRGGARRAGASVIAHYGSDEAGAREATAAIPQDRKLLLAADLADPGAPARLWAEAVAWRGGVDTLVSNAAIMSESPLDAADADWDRTWERRCA